VSRNDDHPTTPPTSGTPCASSMTSTTGYDPAVTWAGFVLELWARRHELDGGSAT
jgi:hypothetical protein